MNRIKVGILAIQGSFAEHAIILKKIKISFQLVRSVADLKSITHLIIPGGESTTLTKLLKDFGIWEVLKKKIKDNKIKIFGTCAGAILCAKLGMNINVRRNAYGSQLESFTDRLEAKLFPNLTGVFIRSPKFSFNNKQIEILATHDGEPVLLRQNNFLASASHLELCAETRIHKFFLKM